MSGLTNDQPTHDISITRDHVAFRWTISRLDETDTNGFAHTRAVAVAKGPRGFATVNDATDHARRYAANHRLEIERVIHPRAPRVVTAEIVQHPLDPCWTWVILERDTSHATHFDAIVAESEDEHATALDARQACYAAAEAHGLTLVRVRDVRRESPAPARKLAA